MAIFYSSDITNRNSELADKHIPNIKKSLSIYLSILKPTANRSPYILTLVQKMKRRVYKIHVFEVKQYFAGTLQVILFKNDLYFLHGRS